MSAPDHPIRRAGGSLPAGRDASAAACDRAPARWRDAVPAALVAVAVTALPVACAAAGAMVFIFALVSPLV